MTALAVLLAGLLLPALEQSQAPICGDVVSYRSRALQAGGCDISLSIQPADTAAGAPSLVHVEISDAARRQASMPPWGYLHRELCVTGATLPDRQQATIRVTDASQLQFKGAPPEPAFGAGALSRCDVPLLPPRLIREVKPSYSAGAMRARIQGLVLLDAVIDTEGRVADVRVVRGLDPQLDEEAMKAVRQWVFEPGQLNGKPVPVLIEVEMSFWIRK